MEKDEEEEFHFWFCELFAKWNDGGDGGIEAKAWPGDYANCVRYNGGRGATFHPSSNNLPSCQPVAL